MVKSEGHSPALYTDLYQLTMAQAYWQHGMTAPLTFSLFIRSYPSDRAYFVLAGIQDVVDYPRSTGKFHREFLEFLAELGFADEPVLEVTAPIIEAQMVKTYLINQINLQSILATKAARIIHAARDRTVVDLAARRTQGTDAGLKLAKVCHMVGYAGTSNVLAGKTYGIPAVGTMAHSYVQVSESEQRAFESYAESFPETTTLLVDTYDTIGGIDRAIEVTNGMRRKAPTLSERSGWIAATCSICRSGRKGCSTMPVCQTYRSSSASGSTSSRSTGYSQRGRRSMASGLVRGPVYPPPRCGSTARTSWGSTMGSRQ